MITSKATDSGILLVDKPSGWTSHDVVNCVRKRFHIKKAGHCGTLDPSATGLLVLLLGRATKLSAQLMGQDKTYIGTMRLGQTTATEDGEGEITGDNPFEEITAVQAEEVMKQFTGKIEQIPPMTSAMKKNGTKLYKLAHKGVEVEREPKEVEVYKLSLVGFRPPYVDFEIHCSKGTYVRTISKDIGEKLGCGAHLHALRRTASGRFFVDQAYTMNTVKQWEREDLFAHIIPLEQALSYV